MLADLIRPSGWHDFWFGNRSAGERATTCCSGPFCQSRVQTNTHKPILWEKRSRFNPTYGISMGALWGIALCTCRKQLILKPPCLSGSCLDQQNRQMKYQGGNLKRFSWSLLWPSRHSLLLWPSRSHPSMSLAAQPYCPFCWNKEHKIQMEWKRGRLMLHHAVCSDLFIQFSSLQTLWSTKCLSSSQIRPSQWTDPVVALIEKWLIRSCSMLVIWSKQMGQLVQLWMLFDIR